MKERWSRIRPHLVNRIRETTIRNLEDAALALLLPTLLNRTNYIRIVETQQLLDYTVFLSHFRR